jgi:hypothetical protein
VPKIIPKPTCAGPEPSCGGCAGTPQTPPPPTSCTGCGGCAYTLGCFYGGCGVSGQGCANFGACEGCSGGYGCEKPYGIPISGCSSCDTGGQGCANTGCTYASGYGGANGCSGCNTGVGCLFSDPNSSSSISSSSSESSSLSSLSSESSSVSSASSVSSESSSGEVFAYYNCTCTYYPLSECSGNQFFMMMCVPAALAVAGHCVSCSTYGDSFYISSVNEGYDTSDCDATAQDITGYGCHYP